MRGGTSWINITNLTSSIFNLSIKRLSHLIQFQDGDWTNTMSPKEIPTKIHPYVNLAYQAIHLIDHKNKFQVH